MLNLLDLAKQNQHSQTLIITERLPDFLPAPCTVTVLFQVEAKDDFYLINLHVKGELHIVCQRCLSEFVHPYDNQTVIAVCRSEERANQLLEQYECIVSSNCQVALDDLVSDELHLYVPQFHPDLNDCDSEIRQILEQKNETN